MDIKVLTKTKVSLIDCTRKNLGLYGKNVNGPLNFVVAADGEKVEVLGEYETEEKAELVLSSLIEVIDNAFKKKESGIIIEMPQ